MATRRVSGGKRIERHEITSADGRKLLVDIYMVKGSGYSSTKFRAICDEIDLDIEGDDVDDVTKRGLKEAAARSDVTWEPWLRVSVKGYRPAKNQTEEQAADLFLARGSGWGSNRTTTTFDVEIHVECFELATIADRKVHRSPPTRDDKAPRVQEGWPRTGRDERAHHLQDRRRLHDYEYTDSKTGRKRKTTGPGDSSRRLPG